MMRKNRKKCWPALMLAASTTLFAQPPKPAEPEEANALVESVAAYLTESDPARSRELLAKVLGDSAGSVDRVHRALCAVRANLPGSEANILTIQNPGGNQQEIRIERPADYDSATACPLVIVLADGNLPKSMREQLANLNTTHIVARIGDYSDLSFNADAQSWNQPARWLAALRRELNIDRNRIYVVGWSRGADAALLWAIMQPDLFAGVVAVEGMLDTPYARQMAQLLLPNLAHTKLHLNWTQPEWPTAVTSIDRTMRVALSNTVMAEVADARSLPAHHNIRRPGELVSADSWEYMFSEVRASDVSGFVHRFRFPTQGHAWFAHTREFEKACWTGDRIHIAPRAAVDTDAAVRKVLDGKLARIEADRRGSEWSLSFSHASAIDLCLRLEEVRAHPAIQIVFEGKRRFSGDIKPDIRTMLESAKASWELDNPIALRLRVGPRGRVLPY